MKTSSRALRRHHRMRVKLRILNHRFIGARPDHHWQAGWLKPWTWDARWYAEGPLEWMTESGHKHWRKAMMTRPARAKEHHALRLLARSIDPDAAIRRWPDHKKPFVYYW